MKEQNKKLAKQIIELNRTSSQQNDGKSSNGIKDEDEALQNVTDSDIDMMLSYIVASKRGNDNWFKSEWRE